MIFLFEILLFVAFFGFSFYRNKTVLHKETTPAQPAEKSKMTSSFQPATSYQRIDEFKWLGSHLCQCS